MADGDTATDQNVTGFATSEQVTLTVTGSPTTVVYTLSAPTTSAYASILATSDIAARFTPDVQGLYVIQAVVDDSTTYILRLSVSVFGAVTMRQAMHLPPSDPADIDAPTVGRVLFSDSTNSSHASLKLPDNSVVSLESFGDIPSITAYDETRWINMHDGQGQGAWSFSGASTAWINDAASPGISLLFGLNNVLVNGQTLKDWLVLYDGAAGHANDPVDGGITMPSVSLTRYNPATQTLSILEAIVDPITGRDAYEAVHQITGTLAAVSSADAIIDLDTYSYGLAITSESGGDYLTSARVMGAYITQTITQIRA